VVRRIPPGRVSTYGEVARLAGLPGCARQVGYALHALAEDSDVPWQRVVNARGAISLPGHAGLDSLQRHMLESEGICFDARGRLNLKKFAWCPHRSSQIQATIGRPGGKGRE